jgi:hypothetical protein
VDNGAENFKDFSLPELIGGPLAASSAARKELVAAQSGLIKDIAPSGGTRERVVEFDV